ncbi:MAG: TetR/AcrR family transcriptional regulator [bacterium]|nr:TetR/AcrR family transcriptional regulator [bacterium]
MSEEVKNKIIKEAGTLFLKYGFKSITMDDIARELGISKKTLYQFFEDKNSLVDQAVIDHIMGEEAVCNQLSNEVENPLERMLLITDSFSDIKKQINPSVLFDLKKYFKSTWDRLNQFRIEFIYNQILINILEGKKAGYYHQDLDESLIARFYIHLVDFMLNPDNHGSLAHDFKTVHNEMMKYHLRSICTEKGFAYLHSSKIYQNLI